jgi:acyl carrier protein
MNGAHSKIDEKLITVFRTVFPAMEMNGDSEIMNASKRDEPSWDSGAHLMLITCLEEEFEVRLSNDVALSIDSYESARAAIVA